MNNRLGMMDKFDFLLGDWDLEYRIPKSSFSTASAARGKGTIRRAMNDRYVYFDYAATGNTGRAEAHAIFAWDDKAKIYRYWWFEDSGNFLTATCNFVNDHTLRMNWHDTLLVQTFSGQESGQIILTMEHPDSDGRYEVVLEVLFTRARQERSV